MHELSLMGNLFEVIEQTLERNEVTKVLMVKIRIGKLTNADPDAMRFAFEAFAQGTPCEGAQLIIDQIPVRGRCSQCGQEFPIEHIFFFCPHCECPQVKIIQGQELLLESMEVV